MLLCFPYVGLDLVWTSWYKKILVTNKITQFEVSLVMDPSVHPPYCTAWMLYGSKKLELHNGPKIGPKLEVCQIKSNKFLNWNRQDLVQKWCHFFVNENLYQCHFAFSYFDLDHANANPLGLKFGPRPIGFVKFKVSLVLDLGFAQCKPTLRAASHWSQGPWPCNREGPLTLIQGRTNYLMPLCLTWLAKQKFQ